MLDLKSFKEEFAFYRYKNKSFKNAQVLKGELIKRYGKNIDVSNIYLRIVDYQVKKYGMTLCRDYTRGDR